MRYLLDANAVIAALDEPAGALSRHLHGLVPADVGVSAGQARARGLTLITRNVREFERVPGLSTENWHDAPLP